MKTFYFIPLRNDQSFSFKYSVRPGTPAARQKKQIDENVKSERLFYLQSLLNLYT